MLEVEDDHEQEGGAVEGPLRGIVEVMGCSPHFYKAVQVGEAGVAGSKSSHHPSFDDAFRALYGEVAL